MKVLCPKTFAKYFVSGSVAVIIHFSILTVLVEIYSANPTLSTSLGFCVGTIFNYLLQYHWTYSASGDHRKVFLIYISVTLSMLCMNALLFWIQVELIGVHYLLAQIMATGVVMLLNYVINTKFTFSTEAGT
jgi:putative flippase GtrA